MKYLIYIALSMFLISCSKDGMIKVKTVNKVTNTPMTGVTIYVIEQFSNSDPNETVFSGETDSNGELMIELKYKNNGKYTIYQSQVENSCWHNEKSIFLEHKKSQNITFEFAPCAQLKLKIENVNCQGSNDEMQFRRLFLGQPAVNWSSKREGCYSFESPGYFDVPMGWVVYEWKGVIGGNEFYYIDSIYLNENENGLMELNY